jgi:hypothetical protein
MLPYKHVLPPRREISEQGVGAGGRGLAPRVSRAYGSYPAVNALPPGFALTGRSGPKPGSGGKARSDYSAMEWQAI